MIIKFNDFILEKNSSEHSIVAYHVTRRKNLKSIMKKGLIPSIPLDYGTNGDIEGVYLFKTIDDAKTALYNWLGERIEEWEEENDAEYDEVLLKIDISDLDSYLIDSVEYEWICTCTIQPNKILDVIEI